MSACYLTCCGVWVDGDEHDVSYKDGKAYCTRCFMENGLQDNQGGSMTNEQLNEVVNNFRGPDYGGLVTWENDQPTIKIVIHSEPKPVLCVLTMNKELVDYAITDRLKTILTECLNTARESLVPPEAEVSGWIGVADRLPRTATPYLVRYRAADGQIMHGVAYYNGLWMSCVHYADLDVTHWMPLPPPPSDSSETPPQS